MPIRASWTIGLFILLFLIFARSITDSRFATADVDSSNLLLEIVEGSGASESFVAGGTTVFSANNFAAIFRTLANGQRSADEIDGIISAIAGESESASLTDRRLQGKYRLSMVLSHYHDLESELQILSLYSLAANNQKDDTVTMYTDRINGADEKAIHEFIGVSKSIEVRDGSLTTSDPVQLDWQLRASSNDDFRMREPMARFDFKHEELDLKNLISPLALLASEQGTFDEVDKNVFLVHRLGETFQADLSLRRTDLETVTVEINLREIPARASNRSASSRRRVPAANGTRSGFGENPSFDSETDSDSLESYTFILVYEPN